MVTLAQTIEAVKSALAQSTLIQNWDFEGIAPDSAFPAVGSVWPFEVIPATMGKNTTYELVCVAALWSSSLPDLYVTLSEFNDELVTSFGDIAPCSPALSSIASQVSLGNLTIGAPSFSAASSAGDLRGTWASIRFTLTIRTL